jgi:hypothetical protein
MLVYPICAPGEAEKPVGVLQMINKIGGAFDSADEERLAAFSKKAAAVISANPMYYKHEEEHETEASALSGALSSPKVRRLVLPCVPPCLLLALGPRPTWRAFRMLADHISSINQPHGLFVCLSVCAGAHDCRPIRRRVLDVHLLRWYRRRTKRRRKRKRRNQTTSSKIEPFF